MPERLKRLRDRPNIKIDSKINIRFKGPKFKNLPDKYIDTIITALYLTVPNVFIRIISPLSRNHDFFYRLYNCRIRYSVARPH